MKVLSRAQLVVLAAPVFEENAVGVLFATNDGQFFVHNDRAKLHVKNSKVKLTVYEISVDEVEGNTPAVDTDKTDDVDLILLLSIGEMKGPVSEITDVVTLVSLRDMEAAKGDEARKGAISLLEKRLEDLAKKAVVITEGDSTEEE